MPSRPVPLVATSDPVLREDLVRLATAAGVEAVVAEDVGQAARCWRTAPVVLVGADLVPALAGSGLPRRPGVTVVALAPGADDPALWREVVALGAESVQRLPHDEPALVALLAAVEGTGAAGPVVAVVGGRGGAGASVLAVGLALAAVRAAGSALLVDLDPWGGGADLLLGAEQDPGLRWGDLGELAGPVSAATLAGALPRPHGVGVVAWDRDRPVQVPTAALRAVLDAGARGHPLVVADLPRRGEELAVLALARAAATFVVVPAEVRAAAAAAQTVAALAPGSARLVVRTGRGRGLDPPMVAAALGLPLAAVLPDERAVQASVAAGDPPGQGARSRLARVSDALVRDLRAAEPDPVAT